jgi:hypothetical protein
LDKTPELGSIVKAGSPVRDKEGLLVGTIDGVTEGVELVGPSVGGVDEGATVGGGLGNVVDCEGCKVGLTEDGA